MTTLSSVIAQLRRSVGDGNFDYLIQINPEELGLSDDFSG